VDVEGRNWVERRTNGGEFRLNGAFIWRDFCGFFQRAACIVCMVAFCMIWDKMTRMVETDNSRVALERR